MKILEYIKNLFIKYDTDEESNFKDANRFQVDGYYICNNNYVDLVFKACKVCVNGKTDVKFKDKLATIGRVMSYGHESVLEHSNLVIALVFNKNSDICQVTEFTSNLHYLNYHTYNYKDKVLMVIGGSLRGYKHIFRNIKDQQNSLLLRVKEILYMVTPKEFYADFINDNIMDESQFIGDVSTLSVNLRNIRDIKDKVVMADFTQPSDIIESLNDLFKINIPMRDALDFATITVYFKKLSRTASHQLVRHRNAISQESQRYVDYSNAGFVNPLLEHDVANVKNKVNILGVEKELDLDEIAKMEIDIYAQLRDHMTKEDARSILPNNVITKLYMTFTFTNFIKFLQLRTASGAQAEIRNIALSLEKLFRIYIEFGDSDFYKLLDPTYKSVNLISYDNIDEPVPPSEEVNEKEDKEVEESSEEIVNMKDISDSNVRKIVEISEKESVDELEERKKNAIKVKTYDELLDKYNSSAYNEKEAVDDSGSFYVCKNGVWLRIATNRW